jgi:hypothetical protein
MAQSINGHRINNYRWQSTQVDGAIGVEIEIDRDPKLDRSLIPAIHTPRQLQKT